MLETGRHMFDRYVVHNRYFVDAEIQHGYAHIRLGQIEQGVAHIVNAFWHGANVGASRLLVPALVETRVLTAQNFLPVSRIQLNLHRRRGPLKHLLTQFPEIFKMPNVGVPTSIGTIDTAIWDWAPLLRAVSTVSAAKKGEVARLREVLGRLSVPPELELEKASLFAMLGAYEGDTEAAVETLGSLAEKHPEDMMVWKRLSHACWLARAFDDAAEAATHAVACGPDVPVIHAWAGLMSMRLKDWAVAETHLLRADASRIGLADVPAQLAQALMAQKKLDRALEAIDRALALAPMEVEFAIVRAQVLDRLGRAQEAITTLRVMVERDRAPAKLFVQLIRLYEQVGNPGGVAEMVAMTQVRFPDHPITARLVAEHAA